jgi:trehalose 6-phosphate phosphatase
VDWSAFRDRPLRAAVLADYDGTLAPIVEDRAKAVPLPDAPRVLRALAGRFAVVGVISGRPVDFLSAVLPCGPQVLVAGLYGLDRTWHGQRVPLPEAEVWRPAIAQAVLQARSEAPEGVDVEDKGLAMALHSRRCPSTFAWATEWAARTAATTGLIAQPGRLSVEVLPPLATDKGSVVEEIAKTVDAVCFFGDDTGDLPAFEALNRLRLQGKTTVAVGVRSPEQPDDLATMVDLLVDGPRQALDVMRSLLG